MKSKLTFDSKWCMTVKAYFYFFVMFLETPSPDEVDVYRNLQVCFEMRKSYVFREAVTPWEKEIITDPSTPKPIPNPFDYAPERKSDV